MKKLILILFLMVSLSGFSQEMRINFRKIRNLETFTVAKDTSYTFKLSGGYYFSFQFDWENLSALDGYIKIQISQKESGDNFYDYNMNYLYMNTATGGNILRDTNAGVICERIRIFVAHGSCTSGTLKINGNIYKKRK